MMELTPVLAQGEATRLEAWRRRKLARSITTRKARTLRQYYRRNPIQYFRDWVWGVDDRISKTRGVDDRISKPRPVLQPIVPFEAPNLQIPLILCLCSAIRMLVLKSREQGFSYCMIGSQIWGWSLLGRSYGLTSTESSHVYDGTTDSLFGKLNYSLRLIHPELLPHGHRFVSSPNPLLSAPGMQGTIIGRPATGDAWQGPRRFSIGVDEIARVPRAEQVMAGVNGATEAPVLGSTPFGSAGMFPRMWRGGEVATVTLEEVGTPTTLAEAEELAAEMELSGAWLKMELGFEDDPRKGPEWEAAKRAGISEEEFEQQWGRNFDSSKPGRIWKHFSRELHVYSDEMWMELVMSGHLHGCSLVETWDIGPGLYITVIWLAVDLETREIFAVDWLGWHAADSETVLQELAAARSELAPIGWRTAANPRGRLPDVRVADAAVSAKVGPTARSWRMDLEDGGVELDLCVVSRRARKLLDQVDLALKRAKLYFGPRCLVQHGGMPSLVDAVSQHSRRLRAGMETPEVDKGLASHPSEALQYGVDAALELIAEHHELWGEA